MDNKDLGWVSIYRSLLYSELWLSEKFTRGQAWVDLIGIANWKPGTIRPRGIVVKVERGTVGWSIRRLAERWRWSPSTVKRFLLELKNDAQIELQMDNVTALIIIINYDEYQNNGAQNEPESLAQNDHKPTAEQPQANPNNKDKEVKKEITTAARAEEDELIVSMPELAVLRTVPGYPFDLKADFAYLSEWSQEFPQVDVVELLKNWKLFIEKNPFKVKSSPRGQLRNQFKMASEKGMYKKQGGNSSGPRRQDAGDRIRQAEEALEKQEGAKA